MEDCECLLKVRLAVAVCVHVHMYIYDSQFISRLQHKHIRHIRLKPIRRIYNEKRHSADEGESCSARRPRKRIVCFQTQRYRSNHR